jgi:hypothetical protein
MGMRCKARCVVWGKRRDRGKKEEDEEEEEVGGGGRGGMGELEGEERSVERRRRDRGSERRIKRR